MAIYQNSVVVNQPLLLISGQTPQKDDVIPDSIEEQLEIVLSKIKTIIEENNCELAKIAKMNVYITDRAYLSAVRDKFTSHLQTIKPAMTLVIVSGLVHPAFKVEIDAVVSL